MNRPGATEPLGAARQNSTDDSASIGTIRAEEPTIRRHGIDEGRYRTCGEPEQRAATTGLQNGRDGLRAGALPAARYD